MVVGGAAGPERGRGIGLQTPTGSRLPRILQGQAATMRSTGAGTTPDAVPALAIVQRAQHREQCSAR
jgi:hypothetical protein